MRVAILLAAGQSRRFGGSNKLLARYRGQPLVRQALACARAAPVGRVIVVTGHDRRRIAAAVRGPRTFVTFARDHREGLAGSLRAGLAALRPIEREIFVFLGDMPGVHPGMAKRLARGLRPGMAAIRPRGAGGPGHPVLLRRPQPGLVDQLRGDSGLGALIAGRMGWIETGPGGNRPADIDTRRDLARWR